jgi:hypothetical protein
LGASPMRSALAEKIGGTGTHERGTGCDGKRELEEQRQPVGIGASVSDMGWHLCVGV